MPVTIRYETLLKRAAGTGSDEIDLNGKQDVQQVIRDVADRHGDPLKSLLVDAKGEVRTSVLIFIGDRQVSVDNNHQIADGDVVTLMSPISGG